MPDNILDEKKVFLTWVTAFTCPVLTVVTGVPTAVSVITYCPWGMVIIWISDAKKNANWIINTSSQTQRQPAKIMSYVRKIWSLKQWVLNKNSGNIRPWRTLQAWAELRQLTPAGDLAIHAEKTHPILTQIITELPSRTAWTWKIIFMSRSSSIQFFQACIQIWTGNYPTHRFLLYASSLE